MTLYCGIDLHSNNHVVCIIDDEDKKIFEKRLPNDLCNTLQVLSPYRKELFHIAVESTFNWYWLVDGLQDNGYQVDLVNTAAVKQYEGIKHTNDQYDAFFLAHIMRLGILPTGYIYPKAERAVRDLLRKRMQLVQLRAQQLICVKGLYTRNTSLTIKSHTLSNPEQQNKMLDNIRDAHVKMAIESNLEMLRAADRQIQSLEETLLKQAKHRPEFKYLLSIPGVGKILALCILYETGEIQRFASVGNYASYCRCVDTKKTSNGKKKGVGNRKNGNKYLAWAFVEAAFHAQQHYQMPKRFFQRKLAQSNRFVATKALAHKLARATYYVMRDQVEFKMDSLFH